VKEQQTEDRFQLESGYRKKLFDLALVDGSNAQLATMLGYRGKWRGRRFTELRDGIIQTMTSLQLRTLSKITNVPLDVVLKHASLKPGHRRQPNNTRTNK
jgi:hypothetical protein